MSTAPTSGPASNIVAKIIMAVGVVGAVASQLLPLLGISQPVVAAIITLLAAASSALGGLLHTRPGTGAPSLDNPRLGAPLLPPVAVDGVKDLPPSTVVLK